MQQTEPPQLGSKAVCSCPSCSGLPLWALTRQCSRTQVPMPPAEGCLGHLLRLHCCQSSSDICSHSLHRRQPHQASSMTRD